MLFINLWGSWNDWIVGAIWFFSRVEDSVLLGLRTSVRQSHSLGSFSNNSAPNFSHICLNANSDPLLLINPSTFDRSSQPARIWTFDFCLPVLVPKEKRSWSSIISKELITAACGVSQGSIQVKLQIFLINLSIGPVLLTIIQWEISSASASAAFCCRISSLKKIINDITIACQYAEQFSYLDYYLFSSDWSHKRQNNRIKLCRKLTHPNNWSSN